MQDFRTPFDREGARLSMASPAVRQMIRFFEQDDTLLEHLLVPKVYMDQLPIRYEQSVGRRGP